MSIANANGRTRDCIVIVGGGLAGQRCAEALRRAGYEGAIRMVCAESRPPYDRPPLSKQVLLGSVAGDSLGYRARAWYPEHDVDLLLGAPATGLATGGRAQMADSVRIDGVPEARSFTATFTRAGRAVAALLVDRPRSLPTFRDLIEKGAPCHI